MHRLYLFLFCALPICVSAQVATQDTVIARYAALQVALERLDTITANELLETEWDINPKVGALLIRLLETPGLTDQEIDSLVSPTELYRVRSADGRLCIFSWDERTGGTFRSQVSVVFFRMPTGEGHGFYTTVDDSGEWNKGGAYNSIHAVRSDSASTVYACVGQVIGCSSCCGDILTIIELTNDGLNLNYPAFEDKGRDGQPNGAFSPTFLLTTRCGNGLQFDYDPGTSTLSYAYIVDDLTPVEMEDVDDAREISGSMHFNGAYFEEE